MEEVTRSIALLLASLASLTALLKLNMAIICSARLSYPNSFGFVWTGSLSPPREATVFRRQSI